MAKLTLSDAARVAGVARSTLHRAIKRGRLSRDPDGSVDTAELLRAGYTLQHSTLQRNRSALQDATGPASALQHPLTPAENLTIHGAEADGDAAELLRAGSTLQGKTLQDATGQVATTQHPVIPAETLQISHLAHAHELVRLERDLLRRALEAAHQREQAAREREALLLRLLEQGQHQQQRLLEAGSSPVALLAPPQPPGHAPEQEGSTPAPPPARTKEARRSPPAATVALPATVPAFDPRKYVLGKLCRRQHDYHGTGRSLLRLPSRVCLVCDRERARARRQAQRQGATSP